MFFSIVSTSFSVLNINSCGSAQFSSLNLLLGDVSSLECNNLNLYLGLTNGFFTILISSIGILFCFIDEDKLGSDSKYTKFTIYFRYFYRHCLTIIFVNKFINTVFNPSNNKSFSNRIFFF